MPASTSFSAIPASKFDLSQCTGSAAVFFASLADLDELKSLSGSVARAIQSTDFSDLKAGKTLTIQYPDGLAAHRVILVNSPSNGTVKDLRAAGAAACTAAAQGQGLTLFMPSGPDTQMAEVTLGAVLKSYHFEDRKSKSTYEPITISAVAQDTASLDGVDALAQGVFFTRDLVNEPANVLTTTEFANRLDALSAAGVKVTVMEEDELNTLGMGALLAVGHGSDSPSKVVIMEWNGGSGDPLALVGKGVVFDTGGISLKPAGGMEDMTMDMGGAGVVSGVMKTLALRKAEANVVGIVGLVENMPSGRATRPGDIVTSMKGDTVEVINTDAEGRLVLADILWHVQEVYKPTAVIDLATLTGAMIIALGHEYGGIFSNDDALSQDLTKAGETTGEVMWRLPLAQAYDDQLKSRLADMKNIGGRPAGSITAAQFLQRFIKEGTPWVHIDIAGVALQTKPTALAPKGATGWGVLALDQLVRDRFET